LGVTKGSSAAMDAAISLTLVLQEKYMRKYKFCPWIYKED
jgi:hypothetical protein